MVNTSDFIADTENVARILHHNWVVDGILQHYAFVLRRNESYISVNRPAVQSYNADVSSFVESHPDFFADDSRTAYMRALVNVGNIRQTVVKINEIVLNIEVNVEPRDEHTKSHAGIFTCREGQYIKSSDNLRFDGLDEEVSSDAVLLEVRSRLLDLSQLELCKLNP